MPQHIPAADAVTTLDTARFTNANLTSNRTQRAIGKTHFFCIITQYVDSPHNLLTSLNLCVRQVPNIGSINPVFKRKIQTGKFTRGGKLFPCTAITLYRPFPVSLCTPKRKFQTMCIRIRHLRVAFDIITEGFGVNA